MSDSDPASRPPPEAGTRLFARLLQLCLLRAGPQDLPYSPPLLRNLVVLLIVLQLCSGAVLASVLETLPRVLLSLTLGFAIGWWLLSLRGLQGRFVQTLTAQVGIGVIASLLLLPLAMALAQIGVPEAGADPSRGQVLVGWIILLLLGWKIAVDAHIWRHALAIPLPFALLLTAALLAFDLWLDSALFGGGQ